MEEEFNFDEIRPYRDNEVHDAIVRVLNEPAFAEVLDILYPGKQDQIKALAMSLKTVSEFQSKIIGPLILSIHDKSGDGIEIEGLDKMKHADKHLYITNHRDIILDAGFLNTLMIKHNMDTAENAIGDNLCARPWITELMKLNKNFIVKRSGTKREIFDSSRRLSAYIRTQITTKSDSIWIAEREGRAKDANDIVQESVLKMFTMSSGKDLKQGFLELNIVPISISYEYDSCDFLKAKEFQQKRDDAEFKKSAADDLINMKTGIFGYRGHVHYEVTDCINKELSEQLADGADRATAIAAVQKLVDEHIHKNYRTYTVNYVAFDERMGGNRFADKYSAEDKQKFDTYIAQQLAKIDLANKDEEFLRGKMLEIYSNPLINKLKANGEL